MILNILFVMLNKKIQTIKFIQCL